MNKKKAIVYLFKGKDLIAKYLMTDRPSNRINLLIKFGLPVVDNQAFIKYSIDSAKYLETTVQIIKR